jgi:trk system potassium uptake protein TrkA
MYVVIVGAGEVGSTIAANLARNHDVAVVDLDGDRVESLTYEVDVLSVEGDGTRTGVLREAGIEEADLLIASTDDDETNLVTAGTANAVADPFTVARVKNSRYQDTWKQRRGAFDVDVMVCTDLLTAETIVRVVGLPSSRDVDTFADGAVRMAEFELPAESPVVGQTVAEADRFEELTFAGVFRDGEMTVPDGDTVLAADDDLVVIGSPPAVRAFGADIAPSDDGSRDVVIFGGSDVAAETARLLGDRGFRSRLVENDTDRARRLAEELPATTVLEEDATNRAFLEREHVGDADVVVTAMDSEERNLLGALLAKRVGADRTVSVVEAAEYVDLFEAVGVDVAVSPRTITAEEITRFTREQPAENVAIIEDDSAEVVEVEVDEDSVLAGRSLAEAGPDLPEGAVVGAITRDGAFVTPRGDTVVDVGDHVVVLVKADVLEETVAKL